MKITVVGAVLIIAAAIVVVLVIHTLNEKKGSSPLEDQPALTPTGAKATAE